MIKHWRDTWRRSLLAGHYRQGFYILRSGDDYYCALGVLADNLVKAGYGKWHPRLPTNNLYVYSNNWQNNALCSQIRKVIGLSYEDQHRIIAMNDVRKQTFAEIAHWIKENL